VKTRSSKFQNLTEIEDELASEFSEFLSNRKILITGGAGFLGSWLCRITAKAGGRVDCLDNFATGLKENIEGLEGVNFILSSVEDCRLESNYDYVFHFASRASPEEYQLHPVETLTANSIGTMRMLELAKKSYGCALIYSSSSEIYGDCNVIPTPETYYGYVNSIGIRSCYDEGKRYGEALCMAYFRDHGLNVRIARIFNSYGERIREDGAYARAIARFIVQALKREPVTIHGDGKQTRSFTYVSDTIRGILKLATVPGLHGEVFNIGSTDEITILEVAKRIMRKTSSESEFLYSPLGQDDPRRRSPDITKAKKKLGWAPLVDMETGLDRTIEYFRRKLSAQRMSPMKG
jgi:UDP-glucuronate decarboxylase